MPPIIETIQQPVFRASHAPITVISVEEYNVDATFLNAFLATVDSKTVGLSGNYGKKGVLSHLAIASSSQVILVQLCQVRQQTRRGRQTLTRRLLEDEVLRNSSILKLAFDSERLATALFLDYRILLHRCVDIQSLVPSDGGRASIRTLMASLGGEWGLCKKAALRTFRDQQKDKLLERRNLALRAWSSYCISTRDHIAKVLPTAVFINTDVISHEVLSVLAKAVRVHDRLESLKPVRVRNDVDPTFCSSSGNLHLQLARFKTRMRESDSQVVVVKVRSGKQKTSVVGRVDEVRGKAATVSSKKNIPQEGRIAVYTLGKEEPTNAEKERIDVILTCLQRTNNFLEQPFAAFVYLGKPFRATPPSFNPVIDFPSRPLNMSQKAAVERILSDAGRDRVCLIQGPPGTGKTTVIAAAVHSMLSSHAAKRNASIWLIAQSNVAVKNIAEKLADTGFFDFKLLVSLDFHFDWHEHLYTKIERNVIGSESFKKANGAGRRLAGCRVILSTISLLSHPYLASFGIFNVTPVETVIVDEASQIEVGGYLPLLSRFGQVLKKLVFIGDDKQLAPFGQDDIESLHSVFELDYLKPRTVFLDTQYRMPRPVGDFISRHVYDGRLKSQHAIRARTSCRLVDIQQGKERQRGESWENVEEVNAVIHIARKYCGEGKSYRIITPYDAQRGAIENALKQSALPWEDKCFNVDSFQGNEDDHIIISVVRSEKTGFLKNLRRSNVMLSRCKQSMTIVTSRRYLENVAASTLLGKLAKEWVKAGQQWISWRDLLASRF